jgi:hypothetical protein
MELTPVPIQSLAQRLMDLFSPLHNFRGTYAKNLVLDPEDGKMKGTVIADGIWGEWNVSDWQNHIDGVERFGAAPLRRDNTLKFAAIDLDVYNALDHAALARKLYKIHENIILCRSKSGGKHLYMFFKDPFPALKVRKKMEEIVSILGVATNPKNLFPASSSHVDTMKNAGAWINLPYFDHEKTLQYAYHPKTQAVMNLKEFLDYAETHKFGSDFAELKFIDGSLFNDGPPCLQILFEQGVVVGNRHYTLLNAAIYAKKKHLGDWPDKVKAYNNLFSTPKETDQVAAILKEVDKKDFRYTCSQEPICSHCDRRKCGTRKFGVNNDSTFPFVESIVKYDQEPPVWWVYLDGGKKIQCTTEQLQNSRLFQICCMAQANIVTPIIKAEEWTKYLHELMQKLQIVEVPPEDTYSGIIRQEIQTYLLNRGSGQKLEDLLMDQAVRIADEYYFTLNNLIAFLKSRQPKVEPTFVTLLLREMGAISQRTRILDTNKRFYSIKKNKLDIQDADFTEVPMAALEVL